MLQLLKQELIFEIDETKIDVFKKDIQDLMTNSVKFDNVALETNTNIGKNWAETK